MVARRLLAPVSAREGRAALTVTLGAYVVFSLFDWITTAVALAAGGSEGNPIAASVFEMFGNVGLLVFKAVVVTSIIAVLMFIPRRIMSFRIATWVAAIFALVSAVTVIHNAQAYSSLLSRPHTPTYHSTAPLARLI